MRVIADGRAVHMGSRFNKCNQVGDNSVDALNTVAAAVTSGKSLKRRNMAWLVATGILDILTLLVIAFHTPIDDLSASKLSGMRSTLTALLPVPILILSYLLSHDAKARLVFWRWENPLPGSRAFSKHAPEDRRIDLVALRKNVGAFPQSEQEQNAAWYALYKQVQTDVAVFESHQNYLLLRDIAAMSLLLALIVPLVLLFFRSSVSSVLLSAAVFLIQYLTTAIASRNNGIRFVQNVLAIHATQKINSRAKPSSAKSKASATTSERPSAKPKDEQ